MAEYKFCPNCGHPLTGRAGSATTKIDLEKLAELRAAAVPSLPPPPALPSLAIEECERCSTTPPPATTDQGWLQKHLRERARRTRKRMVPVVVALLALSAALIAYAWSR
jgi:hypothetical protein